jgi:hypothetical protein
VKDESEKTAIERLAEQVEYNPFETEDPALMYVIERWENNLAPNGGNLVIHGRVSSITTTCEIKRNPPTGDKYDSDAIRSYIKTDFDEANCPFKCDIVVPKAEAEIIDFGGDLGIVAVVLRQLGATAISSSHQVYVEHLERLYKVPDPRENNATSQGGARMIGGDKAKETIL